MKDYKKSFEELTKIIDELREDNKRNPIIVEGEKDIAALKKLGMPGDIVSINKGRSIPDFCDELIKKYNHVIILTDWDRRGGKLCYNIRRNLEGRVSYDIKYRQLIAIHTIVKTVEGLPSGIETLKNKLNLI